MKATLTFNLPEEQSEFNDAVKGTDYLYALNKIREYLRSELKYNENLTETERKTLEKVREEFNGILTDNEIKL
jgi:hypothetical protein